MGSVAPPIGITTARRSVREMAIPSGMSPLAKRNLVARCFVGLTSSRSTVLGLRHCIERYCWAASGDQFCVYVANRFVIPQLNPGTLQKFASGDVNLDQLTKEYIHAKFSYRYLIVDSSKEAYEIESLARSGAVFGQKPFLNPS